MRSFALLLFSEVAIASVAVVAVLNACDGGADAPAPADGGASSTDAPVAPADGGTVEAFTLSSPAVIPGQLIADRYTCTGENVSPPLSWTAGPAATKSYALVFTDLDNGPGGFVHSALWDVPAGTHALPEHLENVANPAQPAGSKQARGYDGTTYGYLGPCPGRVHHYQFKLYALGVATLPGVTTESSLEEVVSAASSHALAVATLDLTSD